MRSSKWISCLIVIFCISSIIASLIYCAFPHLMKLFIFIILVFVAGFARLQLPETRLEISPVNSVILAGIWTLGPHAWIAAFSGRLLHLFINEREKEKINCVYISYGIIVSIITAFLFIAARGILSFQKIEISQTLPMILSIVFFLLFNPEDTFSLIFSGGAAKKIDFKVRIIELAFVPIGILIVLVWNNWNVFYLILIIFPLLMALLFLKKAFRSFQEKDDLNIFYRFTERISSCLDLEGVLSLVTDEMVEVARLEGCLLGLLGEDQKDIVLSVSRGTLEGFSRDALSPIKDKILPVILSFRESHVVLKDELSSFYEDFRINDREICTTPLMEEDMIIGFMLSVKERFDQKDHQYLTIIASQASSAIVNADLYRKAIRANEELREAQAQLIQSSKMAALGQLVAGIAHELNNPLGAVLTNFQTLSRYLKEDLHGILKEAEKAVIDCKTIIEKLLRYSRQAQEGNQKVDLNAVIEDTMELMEDQFAINNITIRKELRKTPPVMANPNYIAQVITNILMNSYDALLKTEKMQKIIDLKSGTENSCVFFSVRDNGTGIAADIVDNIFDPFFTTKEAGKSAGLGLSISKDIVERFGGTITVETKLNESTLFTVRLPRCE